jgi:hypothetical protein
LTTGDDPDEASDRSGRMLMRIMLAAAAFICAGSVVFAAILLWRAVERAAEREEHGLPRPLDPGALHVRSLYNLN